MGVGILGKAKADSPQRREGHRENRHGRLDRGPSTTKYENIDSRGTFPLFYQIMQKQMRFTGY